MATATFANSDTASGVGAMASYPPLHVLDFDDATSGKKTYRVLITDDSEDDRFFLRRAMDDCERFEPVGEVQDGAEAIAYLKGEGEFADRSRYAMPDLLLLDLKMPRATGLDVLKWLREESIPNLKVAVMSGSVLDSDKEQCRTLGADAYFTKSASISKIKEMLHEVEDMMDHGGAVKAA